ncbi:hypothetical protein HAPAU_15420 [Halalkalicoccus paucihalophilus]|uniref:Uncharacterized protein n=1 Tax=Halalkalicoccus paucihalophilus TaxID=1008153 RepID=A0A151AFS0_9EURY|nr:hypothetical protein [Halalkalicoccus paucihalophilus]KYH26444.1 hypothetical protein HAPAU_15420 [Halalkalicoccus paucihalophilus]
MAFGLTTGGGNLVVGGVLLVVGYLVKHRHWTWLISETTALVSQDDRTAPLVGSLVGDLSVTIGGVLVLVDSSQISVFWGTCPTGYSWRSSRRPPF